MAINSPLGESSVFHESFEWMGDENKDKSKSLKIVFNEVEKGESSNILSFDAIFLIFTITAQNLSKTNAVFELTPYGTFGMVAEKTRTSYANILPNGDKKVRIKVPKSIAERTGVQFEVKVICDGINSSTGKFKLDGTLNTTMAKAIIVIDPGHGYTKGNTGAVSFIYTHKVKGDDGNPIIISPNNYKTESSNVIDLPQYVIDDPNNWILSTKEDPNHNERGLVFDIAAKLHDLLKKDGHTCILTRDKRVIVGNDNQTTRAARNNIANNANAQLYISLHADGADGYTSSGAHVIYPKSSDKNVKEESIQLGKDIFRFYNVVQVEKDSPKEDVRGLQVLGATNKTKRKVLVELGFLTTPRDAKALFTNIDRITEQLYQGINFHLKNYPIK